MLRLLINIILLIFILFTRESRSYKSCEANLTPKPPIIVMLPSAGDASFYYPTSDKLVLGHNEEVILGCTGKNNAFKNFPNESSLKLYCNNGILDIIHTTPPIKKGTYDMSKVFECTKDPVATDLHFDGRNTLPKKACSNNAGHIIEVVFEVNQNSRVLLYRTCFNSNNWEAIYSVHRIGGTYRQQPVCRKEFVIGNLKLPRKAKNLNTYYRQQNQKTTVKKMYGDHFDKYFKSDFWVRGHLTPAFDFNLCPQQLASHYIFNAVPQCNKFNSGKWLSLEKTVRAMVDKAKNRGRQDFEIYTGVHDILKLPNDKGIPQAMYLADANYLPVPKYFWKVVYDIKSHAGIAFVASNNMFETSSANITQICQSICNSAGWGNVMSDTITCCEVNYIRKTIDQMADIPPVNQILKQ